MLTPEGNSSPMSLRRRGDYTSYDKDGQPRSAGMATRIRANGQLTVPPRVREALGLAPGDRVQFQLNGNGAVVLRKAPASRPESPRRTERAHARRDAQMRRRAEELLALLRGLD
jgi:antitoxin PrlF